MEIGEEQLRALIELIGRPIVEDVERLLRPVIERQEALEKRVDGLARELEAVKSSVKDAALSTATEFVRQAVETAIEAAGKGAMGRISVATEPVIHRLDELEKRLMEVESLLESSGKGIADAVAVALEQVKRVAEEGVERVREEAGKVGKLADEVREVRQKTEVLQKAVENLTRLVAQQRAVQLPDDVAKKLDLLISAVTALRERIGELESRLGSSGGGRRSRRGGEEEAEGEEEV